MPFGGRNPNPPVGSMAWIASIPLDKRVALWRNYSNPEWQGPRHPLLKDADNFFSEQELAFIGAQAAPADGADFDPFAGLDLGGGGGGGGTVYVGGGAAPSVPQLPRNIDEAKNWIREHYGSMAWALDHPELGPILVDVAMHGYTDLQYRIEQTNWWKTSTQSSRAWDALVATDPNTAKAKRDSQYKSLRGMASTLGVEYANGDTAETRLRDIAEKSLRFGWTADETQRAIGLELRWDGSPAGQAGELTTQYREAAADMGIRMSDRTAFGWARRTIIGETDQAGLQDHVRAQAQTVYASWADQIGKGATVRELAEPWVQTAADLLEVDDKAIDITDAKYQRALIGQEGAPMDLAKWRSDLMTIDTYGWDKTVGAREAAFGLVDQLSRTFGRG